jgi:hypothetical protein
MSDEEMPEMNLAALRFSARMMDAIKGMRSSIIMLMKERGQEWADYPAWDLVDDLIAEYGDDPNAEEA